MTAAQQARIVTALVLAGLGLFLIVRERGRSGGGGGVQGREPRAAAMTPAPAAAVELSPQDTIYTMFDAARAGRVEEYAGQFAGELAASIAQTVAEQGRAQFAAYLERTHGPVKGLAVEAPQQLSDREAKVRTEYVYADRNEAQLVRLEREAAGKAWKIVRLERVERVKTVVPYGTPAR